MFAVDNNTNNSTHFPIWWCFNGRNLGRKIYLLLLQESTGHIQEACLGHGLAFFSPTSWQIGEDLKLDGRKKSWNGNLMDTLKEGLHGLHHGGHGTLSAKSYFNPHKMEDTGYLEPGSYKHRQPPHPDSQSWFSTQQSLSLPPGKQGLHFILVFNIFLTWLRRKLLIKVSLGFIPLSTYIYWAPTMCEALL